MLNKEMSLLSVSLFPTKATMKPNFKLSTQPAVSNHYVVKLNGASFKINEYHLSFAEQS